MQKPIYHHITDRHIIAEAGTIYSLPFELLGSFIQYYDQFGKGHTENTVCRDWFNYLQGEQRNKVVLIGIESEYK